MEGEKTQKCIRATTVLRTVVALMHFWREKGLFFHHFFGLKGGLVLFLVVYDEGRAGGGLLGADGQLNLLGKLAVLLEEILGLLAALAQAGLIVREERAALGNDLEGGAGVDQVAHLLDAFVVHDIELGLA